MLVEFLDHYEARTSLIKAVPSPGRWRRWLANLVEGKSYRRNPAADLA
jgi:hypothetical protein